MVRKELAVDLSSPEPVDTHRPLTPMQALMEAAPGDEPETSKLEMLALRDVLADALDELDPIDREIVVATIIEKAPLRELEKRYSIPKSTIHWRRDRLLSLLRERLEDHPAIQGYLTRGLTSGESSSRPSGDEFDEDGGRDDSGDGNRRVDDRQMQGAD